MLGCLSLRGALNGIFEAAFFIAKPKSSSNELFNRLNRPAHTDKLADFKIWIFEFCSFNEITIRSIAFHLYLSERLNENFNRLPRALVLHHWQTFY